MSRNQQGSKRYEGVGGSATGRGQVGLNEVRRLAPALLELFPERVMLSSRELSEVVKLEACGVPLPQLITWAREMSTGRRGQRMSNILHQLSQNAKRWRTSHVGDKYQQEVQLSRIEIEQNIDELIADVRRAEAELHEPKLREVLSWTVHQIIQIKQRGLLAENEPDHLNLPSVFEHLRSLDDELQERLLIVLPFDIQRRVQARMQKILERESNRSRPQDFMIAQRSVYWALLSEELDLPEIHLSIFDQW